MVSGYPTSTNIPRVDGLSTDPREMGRLRYHTETMNESNKEYLYITSIISGSPGNAHILLLWVINPFESYVVVNQKFNNLKVFIL